FEVIVSHVCTRWRAIALASPLLWTTIRVKQNAVPPFDKLITWLARSRAHLISVAVGVRTFGGALSMTDAHLNQVLTLLAPHAARLRSFLLMVSHKQLQGCLQLLAVPPVRVPTQLRQLVVFTDAGYRNIENLPSVTFFNGNLPRLESVVLHSVSIDWEQRWLKGSPHLTNIRLGNCPMPSWEIFVRFLTELPRLEALEIDASCGSDWDPEQIPSSTQSSMLPTLPALQRLELTDMPLIHVSNILTKLALPRLASLQLLPEADITGLALRLAAPPQPGPGPSPHPSSVLHGLTDLNLSCLRCAPHCVALLFRALRAIERITLDMTTLPPEFLQPLECRGDASTWVPTLRTLCTAGVSRNRLHAIVAARRLHGYPLEVV
ncbi:hypothetical protein BJ138DRAFT_981051, partial [Hygrophoropsis aurantiaca]